MVKPAALIDLPPATLNLFPRRENEVWFFRRKRDDVPLP
jgi:hypothetical protein